MAKNDNMKVPLPGIFQITGEHNVGKTTFALGCGASPEEIIFFDDDIKGDSIRQEMEDAGTPLGKYINMSELSSGVNEYEWHIKVLKEIRNIKANQYKVAIFDTWSRFAESTHSYVLKHKSEFKNPSEWSAMGIMKSGQEWKVSRFYEADIVGELSRKVPTIFLVAHLKNFYLNNARVPGKFVPSSTPTVDRICRARFWLRKYSEAIPSALVLKQLDKKVFIPGEGIRTTMVLPRKISPLDGDASLWDSIKRYWNSPVGNRELTEDERLTKEELSIIDGSLTDEQSKLFNDLLVAGLLSDTDNSGESTVDKVLRLHEEGKPIPIISSQIGLPVEEVKKIIS